MATSVTDEWTCPTCKVRLRTQFCPICGERVLLPRDLTFRGLFDPAIQAVTNIGNKGDGGN